MKKAASLVNFWLQISKDSFKAIKRVFMNNYLLINTYKNSLMNKEAVQYKIYLSLMRSSVLKQLCKKQTSQVALVFLIPKL